MADYLGSPARRGMSLGATELKAWNPSLRERLGGYLYDAAKAMGYRDAYPRSQQWGQILDFIPGLGDAMGVQEAKTDYDAGNYLGAGVGMSAAALGLVPGVGDALGVGLKKGIRAFHGSPHDFDKFDMSKIGTGEGAQAYGHGLYFAENEGVAKGYREALAGAAQADTTGIDGAIAQALKRAERSASNSYTPKQPDYQGEIDKSVAATIEHLAALKRLGSPDNPIQNQMRMENIKKLEASLEALQTFKLDKVQVKTPGRMYEVNIDANPDDFLDWDKPLSEQPAKVREHFKGAGVGFDDQLMHNVLQTYDMAKGRGKMSGFDPAGAQELREAGVPGIKYLDQGSRTAGDGSRNYVVFDDKLISIVRKYGIAAAVAGGIITQQQAEQMTEQGLI